MKHLPLLLLLLVSCRGTQTVVSSASDTTERVQIVRDTVRLVSHQRDTLVLRDSVFSSEKTVGDTVRIETTRWRTEWKTLVRTDTVWRWRTDSAAVSETKSAVKETQNRPSRTRLFLFGITLLLIGVFLTIFLHCIKNRPWK